MKYRNGFVSNSSSSSFICLGTENPETIAKLLKAEGIEFDEDEGSYPEQGYGRVEGKTVDFIGISSDGDVDTAGISDDKFEEIFEKNSITEAKKVVVDIIKKELGVDVPEDELKLSYGETSDPW